MKILFVLAFVTALAACGARSSAEEEVRALVASAEAAAEARDTSDVLELVADDYADARGLDKTQLRNFLRAYFIARPKIELIVNVEKIEIPVPELAHVTLTVATLGSETDLERLAIELRRVEGDWRVVRADRRQP
jgi:hypothetical protein